MMGNGKQNENEKLPSSFPLTQTYIDHGTSIRPNEQAAQCTVPGVGNGAFDAFPNRPPAVAATRENALSAYQSYASGIPDTGGNLMTGWMTINDLQNPMIDLNCDTRIQSLAEVPLLPEWNTRGIPHGIDQASMNHGASLSNCQNLQPNRQLMVARNLTGDFQISRQGRDEKLENIDRLQIIGDCVSSPLPFCSQDSGPTGTGYSVNSNTTQHGFLGKADGSFLSLGIGGTGEAVSRPKHSNMEVSNKRKETASPDLNIGCLHQGMGQNTLDGSMGLQRNANGSSNTFFDVDRSMTSHNGVEVLHTPNSGPGCGPYDFVQTPQNDMQLDISICGSNPSALSNRNVKFGDLDSDRAFGGDQAALLGTLGNHSARFIRSRQQDMHGVALGADKPLWTHSQMPSEQLQNVHLRSADTPAPEYSMNFPSVEHCGSFMRQNYAEQLFTDNVTATQVVGPQGAGNHGAQAATDSLFPKRLGVDFNEKFSSQSGQRYVLPAGISMQTTGEVCQHPDNKGSSRLPDHLLQHSVTDQTDGGMPIHYPLNSQGPFSNTGQFQDNLVQSSNHPHGDGSTKASTAGGLSQRSDFPSRPSLKRIAVSPPPASHWVQRQKMTHPTVHPSITVPPQIRPSIPNATVHPSVPITSQTNPNVPVTTAPVPPYVVAPSQIKPHIPATMAHPSIPSKRLIKHSVVRRALAQTSLIKPPISATTAYAAAHIKWQDPGVIARATGHKCLLCKRDLSYTSEGRVYQPTPPPPVAVLPCGHTFHDQCLHNITPQDQSKDPPCIPCAIGEN